ncbi:MAG: GyrI-like domain-containing protein [Bosea sp. (in: a-proteobacteria)]
MMQRKQVMARFVQASAAGVLALLLAVPAMSQAQAPGVAAPQPVETRPLAPPPSATPAETVPDTKPIEIAPAQQPPAASAPATPPVQAQPVPPPAGVAPLPGADSTLAGKPGDPNDIDEVALVSKPVISFSGQTTWDNAFLTLSQIFTRLRIEAAKADLKVTGRPLALFIETDDNGFKYEAMLPVDRVLEGRTTLSDGIRLSRSPDGRSLRFTHKAPYDDIDGTYETITAYLEAKGIVVKDAFLEEYVSDLKDAGDPALEINVYVLPR